MYTFWSIIQTEWRLAWRSRTLWVVQGVVAAISLFAWLTSARSLELTGVEYVADVVLFSLQFQLLLLPIIVGSAVARDLEARSDILWTTPLDAFVHLMGVVLGLWLALLPMVVLQVAVQWLAAFTVPGVRPDVLWRYALPLLLAGTTLGIGISTLLATCIRRTLPLLVIWGPLWVGLLLLSGSTPFLQSLMLASPFNVFLQTLEVSPSVGLGPSAALVRSASMWFVGAGMLAALLGFGVALLTDRRRILRRRMPAGVFAVLAVAVAGGGFLWHAQSATAQALVPSPLDNQANMWQVRKHTLEATIDPQAQRIEGTSTLTLVPAQPTDQIVLRFNAGMTVTEAHDANNQSVTFSRNGDSIVFQLAAPIQDEVTLQLAWQGTPRTPYVDYGVRYGGGFNAGVTTPDRPNQMLFIDQSFVQPQPVGALLHPAAGYLLRDGNWYPWPWTTQPHQAEQTNVTLHTADPRALTSAPLVDGTATWQEALPPALLTIPPTNSFLVNDSRVYIGAFAGSKFIDQVRRYAQQMPDAWRKLGETPPKHLIVLPYLNDFVRSDDLLLMPETTGWQDSLTASFAYEWDDVPDLAPQVASIITARAWLAQYAPTDTIFVRAVPEAFRQNVDEEARWDDPQGRWIETTSLATDRAMTTAYGSSTFDPITWLRPLEGFDAMSQWLAQTLSQTPAVEQTQDALVFADQAAIAALHQWASEIGTERALQLVGETIRSSDTFDLEQIMGNLEKRSGVPLLERWRALIPEPQTLPVTP